MTSGLKLKRLKPVEFHSARSAVSGRYVVGGLSKTHPKKQIISEMKKLSKKDVYVSD